MRKDTKKTGGDVKKLTYFENLTFSAKYFIRRKIKK